MSTIRGVGNPTISRRKRSQISGFKTQHDTSRGDSLLTANGPPGNSRKYGVSGCRKCRPFSRKPISPRILFSRGAETYALVKSYEYQQDIRPVQYRGLGMKFNLFFVLFTFLTHRFRPKYDVRMQLLMFQIRMLRDRGTPPRNSAQGT